MQSIHCKYLPLSASGVRIKAECGAGSLIYRPTSDDRDDTARFYRACEALQQKLAADQKGDHWLASMVGGCLKDGSWVFVFADSRATRADPREELELTRINNDFNGNPRHVVHFRALCKPEDDKAELSDKYAIAVKRAHAIGGRKFHNKSYGGGIVFQCYGKSDILPHIERVTGRTFK